MTDFRQSSVSHALPGDALALGTRLQNGALVITRVLSHSNFAITYAARDETLHREVAVKEFFPFGCRRDHAGNVAPPEVDSAEPFETTRALFIEEARVLAQFHHSGIVAVHAFFEANNTAYMVMELLRGSTLSELLETRGRFGEPEVLQLAAKVGDALQIVHCAGLLHRDLKPDNIFSCDDGRIVLLDFGLSTRVTSDAYGTRRLDTTNRFGTPGYAPPEQYTSDAAQNAASDIYSFGATLYHLLTGTAPPAAIDRAFGARLDSPRRVVAGVSTDISNTILRAMRLKPEQRPQSVGSFLERLQQPGEMVRARAAFVGILKARTRQLQTRMNRDQLIVAQAVAPASSRRTKPLDPPSDDSGCLQFAFAAYLLLWLFAAVICAAWFFVQFVSRNW